jgi:hypothetical protein
MPTQDSGVPPRSETDRFVINTDGQRISIEHFNAIIRETRDAFQLNPEPDLIEPTEPQIPPARDRFPSETVWIMPMPSRRGPGRVADITRYERWNNVFQGILNGAVTRADFEPSRPGFIQPSRLYREPGWGTSWWFLGWHDNNHPMFAVRLPGPIMEESEIRQSIRALISESTYEEQCAWCGSSHPVSDGLFPAGGTVPVPSRTVGRVPGHGAYNRSPWTCSVCWSTLVACTFPGCSVVDSQGRYHEVVTDTQGTTTLWCDSNHSGTGTRCPHCMVRFTGMNIMASHNCIDSDQDWTQCYGCGGWSRHTVRRTMTNGSDQDVCVSRRGGMCDYIRECASCQMSSRTTHESFVTMAPGSSILPNRTLCGGCAAEHGVEECSHCGRPYPEADDHDCEGTSCGCYNCRATSVIRSYGYRPKPRFRGSDKHGLFLGMELEIFCSRDRDTSDVAGEAQEVLGKVAYIKSDSSVTHGFEIVTHPMSFTYAMEEFPWEVLDRLDDLGSYDTDNSGIHVHVSRAGFSGPRHEYSWMIFAHRNNAQFSRLARRVSDQWASFSDQQRTDAKAIATKKKRDHTRYRAINQTNTDTIEVRIFRSSLDVQSVKAALGLVHASIEYTRSVKARDAINDKAWSWSAFAKWLRGREEYAPLLAEMVRLNCTEDSLAGAPMPREARPVQFIEIEEDDTPSCECEGGYGRTDCEGRCDCDECQSCRDNNDDATW